jgi:hypothetical protein
MSVAEEAETWPWISIITLSRFVPVRSLVRCRAAESIGVIEPDRNKEGLFQESRRSPYTRRKRNVEENSDYGEVKCGRSTY